MDGKREPCLPWSTGLGQVLGLRPGQGRAGGTGTGIQHLLSLLRMQDMAPQVDCWYSKPKNHPSVFFRQSYCWHIFAFTKPEWTFTHLYSSLQVIPTSLRFRAVLFNILLRLVSSYSHGIIQIHHLTIKVRITRTIISWLDFIRLQKDKQKQIFSTWIVCSHQKACSIKRGIAPSLKVFLRQNIVSKDSKQCTVLTCIITLWSDCNRRIKSDCAAGKGQTH